MKKIDRRLKAFHAAAKAKSSSQHKDNGLEKSKSAAQQVGGCHVIFHLYKDAAEKLQDDLRFLTLRRSFYALSYNVRRLTWEQ